MLSGDTTSPTSKERLRRAVSTAYYAIFHDVARRAATTFMGHERVSSGGYQLIYRSFDHRRLKDICKKLGLSRLDPQVQLQLRRNSVSEEIKSFATVFLEMQEARHAADYDPLREFDRAEVDDLIEGVEAVIAAFDRAPPDERADVLALMMVKPRG